MIIRILHISVYCFLFAFAVKSQKLRFDRFTVEDGLQNNIVLTVTEGAKGMIWFGSGSGIDRFDGASFKSYSLSQKNSKISSVTPVSFLFSDKKDIWAATSTAVYQYNIKKDAFEIPASLNSYLLKGRMVSAMAAGFSKQILVGYNSGFLIYRTETQQVIPAPRTYNKYVRCLFQDSHGVLWVAANKGLQIFKVGDNVIEEISHNSKALELLDSIEVTGITQDYLGRYWFATSKKGILVYDQKTQTIKSIAFSKVMGQSYAIKDVYHQGKFQQTFVSTDGGGLLVIGKSLEVTDVYQTNEDNTTTISSNAVYDVFEDSYNRLWVTTYGGGINVVKPEVQPFENFTHELNNNNSLASNAAKAFTQDEDGNYWFGTRKGISKLNLITGNWTHINEENAYPSFTADNVLTLTVDGNFILAGTYGGGLIMLSTEGKVIKTFRYDANDTTSLGTDFVYSLLKDQKDRLWAGGLRGALCYYTKTTQLFRRIKTPVLSIYCLIENSKGEILAGTEKGLYVVRNDSLENYLPGVITERVQTILEYEPGVYWVGSLSSGIFIIDKNRKIEKKIAIEDGLPSNIICGLIKEENGDVWIGTSRGIVRYQVKLNVATTYSRADGLAGSQVNYNAVFQTRSGKMIFGTTNGFSQFNPKNIKATGYKPVIVFTSLFINNKRVTGTEENSPLIEQLDEIPQLILKHNQNSFTIDFVNTSPAISGKHLYVWKLEGFDKIWSEPSTVPTAVYTNLNSGKYKLLVKSFSKGQNENHDIRELQILIKTPWWLTIWAYIAYLLLLSAAFLTAYNYYTIHAARKKYADRLKLNTSISHEIRTPLTLIKGPVNALNNISSLTDEQRSNLTLARKNIEKLEAIISQFIDYQKSGISKMQMQVVHGDLVHLLDDVIASFKPLLCEKNISFTYKKMAEPVFLLFDKEKMEKIFNNLLSNAVKYTPSGKSIAVEIKKSDKYLVVDIVDTGIGVPDDQQRHLFKGYFRADNTLNLKETGSGIGLTVTKELIEMHKGKLEFESEQGKGSRFTVKLPLYNEALQPYLVNAPLADNDQLIPVLTNDQPTSLINKHILIAEDNDELRFYLKNELTAAGYKVTATANGKMAHEALQQQDFDLVITDVMMPEMNGFQLATAMKKEIATCHIPVIMLTAIHDKDYLLEGYRCGADDFVRKPFDMLYILTRIENLIQNRTIFRKKVMSVFEQDPALVTEDQDMIWLKEVTTVIVDNISDTQFSVEKLATLMTMSRPVLFRKFKSLTNDSPVHYINQLRMRRAVELLQQKKHTINEVAFECGFADSKYFSTTFKKHFGKSPREYIRPI